jgi:ribonuclease PH
MAGGKLTASPIQNQVAAVSVGVVGGQAMVDLCYVEDVAAEVDMNLAMTGKGEFIELQGTGEESTFTDEQLGQMMVLGRKGIRELLAAQETAIAQ